MGARISYCHLSFSLYLLHTVRMMFLPRLPLLMFIAFLGYRCNTIVKADDTMKSCLSVEGDCNQNPDFNDEDCQFLLESCHWMKPNGGILRWCTYGGKKRCSVDCGANSIEC